MDEAKQHPKILYFTQGGQPIPAERQDASFVGVPVEFRSIASVDPANLEECDGVAGIVPTEYQDKPRALEVVKAWQGEPKPGPAATHAPRTTEPTPEELTKTKAK